MDKFIQDIVAVDRECSKLVEEANKKRNDVQSNMNTKKKEIYDACYKTQQEVIDKHKAKLNAEILAIKKQNEKDYEVSYASLEARYKEKKDSWVETIVEHCKEI